MKRQIQRLPPHATFNRWDLAKLGAQSDHDLALAEAGLAEWADALDREDRRPKSAASLQRWRDARRRPAQK